MVSCIVPELSSQRTDGCSGKTNAKYIHCSPHFNHPNDLTPPKSNHHSIYATNHSASVPPFRNNRKPPQPSFHPNHPTKWEISKTTTCASQTIPLNIIHPYTKLYLSPQITSPINHQLTIQTTQFVISAMTTFASKTKTQCTTTTTTSLPTTITTQSTFKFDGEHEKIPHHIQYVHERKVIKAYLSEHSHRRVCSNNKEKKHHIQFIKDNTNKNLIGNVANQNTPQVHNNFTHVDFLVKEYSLVPRETNETIIFWGRHHLIVFYVNIQ